MIELRFAGEALEAVRAFLQLGTHNQFIYRTSLSGIYYAAHHLGRLLLTTIGLHARSVVPKCSSASFG